jgi:hypothetical protein
MIKKRGRAKPRLKILQMKMEVLTAKKEKLNCKEITKIQFGVDIEACACCKTGKAIRVFCFDANF